MSNAILTTSWDDGHPLDLRLADLLERHGIQGTFYIPRQSQLATLCEADVSLLSDRFEIGGHTLDHLALTSLPDEEASRQVRECKAWVEDTTGKPCPMFCPPLGKFDQSDIRSIAEAGYLGFRSVELLQTRSPHPREQRERKGQTSFLWEMPTTVQSHPHKRTAYLRNAMKRFRQHATLTALTSRRISDWPSLAEHLLQRCLHHGGVFHLWGHSWEIEQEDQWQSLDKVLSMLGEHVTNGNILTMNNSDVCQHFAAGSSSANQ
ncbi:MAG: polysaccharide deacetylase family protein [Rhodopirellula sp. JB053]